MNCTVKCPMSCKDAKPLLSPYLDGAVSGAQMHAIAQHLAACSECNTHYLLLRQTQSLVSGLGKKQAPPELALRLRLAISREAVRPSAWEGFKLRFEDGLRAFMVPATAGVLSAVLFFGLLIGFFALPPQLRASSNDVPTSLYTPPQLKSSPFEFELGARGGVVVEAYVDANGRVQDYKILSDPDDAKDILPELNNMLIFTVFQPATSFGQPTPGRAILSFEKINVKG
jgi:hypothetical protein